MVRDKDMLARIVEKEKQTLDSDYKRAVDHARWKIESKEKKEPNFVQPRLDSKALCGVLCYTARQKDDGLGGGCEVNLEEFSRRVW